MWGRIAFYTLACVTLSSPIHVNSEYVFYRIASVGRYGGITISESCFNYLARELLLATGQESHFQTHMCSHSLDSPL